MRRHPVTASHARVLRQVSELTQAAERNLSRKRRARRREETGEEREVKERLLDKMAELQEQIDELSIDERRGAHDAEFGRVEDIRHLLPADQQDIERLSVHEVCDIVCEHASDDKDVQSFQRLADDTYFTAAILGHVTGRKVDPRSLAIFKKLKAHPTYKRIIRAPITGGQDDPGAADMGPWSPVAFSAQLKEQVRVARRIAQLHERIPMPTNPYKLPIEGADALLYTVPEAVSSEAYVDSTDAGFVPATAPIPVSNLTLTALKQGSRLVVNAEADEQSIIRLLPYYRRKLVRAIRDGEEDTALNGDLLAGTGGALDQDMQQAGDAGHHRASYSGYRKHGQFAGISVDGGGVATIDLVDMRTLRKNMDKFALGVNEVVWIVSPAGWYKLVDLTLAGERVTTTVDKYGQGATILTGEVGRIDGIPIIVSGFVRNDLNASGVFDNVTETHTHLLLMRPEAFLFGDFRSFTLNSRYVPDTDQNVMVALGRQTFGCWWPNDPVVGSVYGILV